MKTVTVISASILAGAMLVVNIGGALAQTDSQHRMGHGASSMHGGHQAGHQAGHGGHSQTRAATPTLPGQDAFGAIQEIVAILEADPATDWSRVDISKLRAHLADMNRLVMDSSVRETRIKGGLRMVITGRLRALQAIQAMVPAHAPTIDGLNGWKATAGVTKQGAILQVTSADAKQVARIRGLGFYGLMVSGSHHQAHHLAMARGADVHAH